MGQGCRLIARLGNPMRAHRKLTLILIDRGKESSSPERVYRHTPILVVQKEPNCTRVYYEDLPYAKRKALTWGQFKKTAKLARLPEIGRASCRGRGESKVF